MHGLEYEVALRVGDGALLLCVAAPEHIDDSLLAFGDGAHHGVGEGLPSAAGMRGRFVFADRQHGVQQQHSLLGPPVEVTRGGDRRPGIVGDLLEDVLQRGREGDAVGHREAESVGLPGSVVGVLSDDDDLQPLERTLVEGAEYVAAPGIDAAGGILLAHEVRQCGEIGLLELGSEHLFPVGSDLYVHVKCGLNSCKSSKKSFFSCYFCPRNFFAI